MSNEEITIRRGKYRKNYTVFPNDLCQNRAISYEAKGLLVDLLSRPENWIVHINTLTIPGHCGRDKVKRMIRELVQAGFIEDRIRLQDEKTGKFSYTPYIVNDTPIAPLTEKPSTGEPSTGEPSTANPHLQSTDRESTEKESNIFTASAGEDIESPSTLPNVTDVMDVYETVVGRIVTPGEADKMRKLIEGNDPQSVVSAIHAAAAQHETKYTYFADKVKAQLATSAPVKVAPRLKPYFDAIRDNRPLSFTAPGSDGMILKVAKTLADTPGIEPDDIAPLYAHVAKLTANWTVPRTINTLVSHAPDYIEKRNARARAQEQRAAAPDEPIDYEDMLADSLKRASLYEATGD